ncbi:MAG: DUF3011 domain-containing protein [Bdellovibrionales bacterium]|nr:DUF3011 domain-containing protein [Bdellovibrionales bacterium]
MIRNGLFVLILLGSGMAVQPAIADDTITCESQDNRYQLCRVGRLEGKEVRLDKKLSSTSCEQGRTWGVAREGIWVDRGCRARFSISSAYHNDRDYDRGNHHHPDRDWRDRHPRDWRDRDWRDQRPHDWRDRDGGYHSRDEYDRGDRYDREGGRQYRVSQALGSGTSWVGPRIDLKRLRRIRVQVRRLNAAETDTHLSVGFDNYQQLGAQQVDSEKFHWLDFPIERMRLDGRKIVVTAHSGTIFVNRVIVE